MQKIINSPDTFVDEAVEGVLLAHGDELRRTDDPRALARADAPVQGKVGIVTGGGFGHLPLFLGYVGRGLADAVAVGNVFASPSSEQMLAATRAANGGAGVLYLFGNYGGDVMNFEFAGELATAEGITTETVLGTDDVASAPRHERERRRGIAGIVFLYKVAGAKAEAGATLEEVAAATRRAGEHVATMSVGLAPCTLPAASEPTFELAEGEMEIGVGIHGEPGVRRGKLDPADQIAEQLVDAVAEDLSLAEGERVAVLLNGLGATPPEELYILYRSIHHGLEPRGVAIDRTYIGEFATSLEMAGASLSVMRLDAELTALLDAPSRSPLIAID